MITATLDCRLTPKSNLGDAMSKLYVESNNAMIGPIESKEVIELIRKGDVTRTSKISIGESDEWRDAGSLKQLEPYFTEADAIRSAKRQEEQRLKAETVKVVAEKTDDAERIGKAVEMALLRTKSFKTHVVATVILYLAGWIPGLIANAVWYGEATETSKRAGVQLPGTRDLLFLFAMNLILAIAAATYYALTGSRY